ncbi:acylneuraminate cytidylyltransferase family protein [Polaribacter undariae]|uniref:Acylneuraminate cytidylyltransferase family protein n=1 Tax=Polaribacter sejongensis TaxID=985043 RepID=A0AAJ1QVM2_9FLAO|nr:acylneuraminate cytidylyltransferase family protein [Polaribacter undariae]MDN3618940.1 acylneuraminate cytidylyltransferase family protein [Polaribacter undariae]UWD33029.1 acylneuraminate cytidylyltransferase family protein [Polaribacter undariae]
MKNIVIIPARGGSKRLKNKNILELEGIPLFVHSINYAKENSNLDIDIVVSTDDVEIKRIALENDAIVVDRPDEISGDFTTTVAVMKHVIDALDKKYDHVILLQPTNPLRPKELLQNAFNSFIKGSFDSLMTVSKNEHKLGKIINNIFVPYTYQFGQRSQDLEALYYENGLLYITKTALILKEQILGEKNYPFIVEHPFAKIDIDTLEDFNLASFYYKTYKNE